MDFLGIGPFEIALVVLIAFIVLGPDRIPGVMRQLGTWVRKLREFTNNMTRDYGSDIQQITGEITALQDELRSIQRELGQAATGFMSTTLPPEPSPSIAPERPSPVAPTPQPPTAPVTNPNESPADPAPAEPRDSYTI